MLSSVSSRSGTAAALGESNETTQEYELENMTLDLEFRLMKGIEGGRYLIPD